MTLDPPSRLLEAPLRRGPAFSARRHGTGQSSAHPPPPPSGPPSCSLSPPAAVERRPGSSTLTFQSRSHRGRVAHRRVTGSQSDPGPQGRRAGGQLFPGAHLPSGQTPLRLPVRPAPSSAPLRGRGHPSLSLHRRLLQREGRAGSVSEVQGPCRSLTLAPREEADAHGGTWKGRSGADAGLKSHQESPRTRPSPRTRVP